MRILLTTALSGYMIFSSLCLSLDNGFYNHQNNSYKKDETNHKLKLKGHTASESKRIADVTIKLLQETAVKGEWQEVSTVSSDKKGDFQMDLSLYQVYKLEISKDGYLSKSIVLSTDVYNDGTKDFSFEFEVDMEVNDGKDYLDAVASVYYDKAKHAFDYTLDYRKAGEILK